MESIDKRKDVMVAWLKTLFDQGEVLLYPMQGDASSRRYFRLKHGERTFVVMDAPPPQETIKPFVAIANALREKGLCAPEVMAENVAHGFLLLTDFGDTTYLKALTDQNADDKYDVALTALSVLQSCRKVREWDIPPFTREFMLQEWAWHKEWFLQKFLGVTLGSTEAALDKSYLQLVEMAANQPQVFMHRDFHSANLMVLANGSVGLLDFQDAFIGPITYDLASLLRDCYISWPEASVERWALAYLHKLQVLGLLKEVDAKTFLRWFDWMGMQRHLKALMTFARKKVRDQEPAYVAHIPRTLHYITHISERYPELKVFHDVYQTRVMPCVQ